MTHCWYNQKVIKESDGFSVLELVAVIGVLSFLQALQFRVLAIIESSQIDEAKALLSTTAADCLQKNRLNDEQRQYR